MTREKFHRGGEDDQSCPPRIGRLKEINEPNINHREARHLHPWRVEARNTINRRAALPLSGRRLCISHPVTFLRFLLRLGVPNRHVSVSSRWERTRSSNFVNEYYDLLEGTLVIFVSNINRQKRENEFKKF